MHRSWFLGVMALVVSVLLPAPQGYTETELFSAPAAAQVHPAVIAPAPAVAPVRSRNAAEVSAVHEVAIGLADPGDPVIRIPARSAGPSAIQLQEPARRVTLEELRRSIRSYPDQDLVGCLWEQLTRQGPLFGEEE